MTAQPRRRIGLHSIFTLALTTAIGCGGAGNTEPDNVSGTGSSNAGGTSNAGGASAAGGSNASGGAAAGSGGAPTIHATCPGDLTKAYGGDQREIPGTIQAEDFDIGGYSDATTGNEGAAYRTDVDVDIKSTNDGFAVGWMTAGEWLEYTLNVAVEGDYSVVLHAGAVDAGRTVELSSCGTALGGPIAIPQVSAWGDFSDSAATTIHLTPGLQVIRVTAGALDYLDIDSLSFTSGAAAGTGGAGTGGAGTGGATGGASTGGAGTGGALPKFVGNITTGWNGAMDTDGRIYKTYWDQVTPENAGKWGSVQSTAASAFNWGTLDAIYDYSIKNGIIFKQHTFVWGSQQPTGNITEANVKTWIQTFCKRYPETKVIDVVNEPPPHTEPSYANAIGGGTNGNWAWIANAFKWAHEYCPNAILVLNDYNNIEYGDQNQHFIDIVKAIKAAGAPIDAVGAQSHGLGGGVSTSTMKTLITKLHNDTGLPVYITEYDIDQADDTAQLNKFKEHIPFFMQTEWIHGVTIWGWIYGKTWIPASGLIKDGKPRPAMTWLMDQLGRPAP